MKKIFLLFLSLFTCLSILQAEELSFKEYIANIETHAGVMALKFEGEALKEFGSVKGSWGDPKFQVMAQNFPKDSLKDNETPMTGVKYTLSQKIAITDKYGNLKDAMRLVGVSKELDSENKKLILIKLLWVLSIEKRKAMEDLKIFKENLQWINKMHKISKRLYSTGKVAQQALLDIQIRKSEIQSMLDNTEYYLKEIDSRLSYFIDQGEKKGTINLSSIPWTLLNTQSIEKDFVEKSLAAKLRSRQKLLSAHKKGFLPDITLGFSYTQRSNIDNKGDFVGASITFPLPFSASKYGNYGQAVNQKYQAEKSIRNYRLIKSSRIRELDFTIRKITNELNILKTKIINYAKNSREITSKSYRLGKSNYSELLKAELQLQEILMKKNRLISMLDKTKVERNYIKGVALYEIN